MMEEKSIELKKSTIGWIVVWVVLALLVFKMVFVVGPGRVGVIFNALTGKTRTANQGTNFKVPFVEGLSMFDVRTQRLDITAEGASKDLQLVKIMAVLNFHLDYAAVDRLFIKVGRDFNEKIIDPAVNESVKSAVAQYQVERIIVEREKLKNTIEEALRVRLSTYDIILENLNLVDIDFAEEFNKVVEEKQIEEQKIKTAEYQRMQAEQYKQKTILEAQGEAAKQALLRDTVSEKVVQLKFIEKWDGKMPTVMSGDKMMLMLPTKGAE